MDFTQINLSQRQTLWLIPNPKRYITIPRRKFSIPLLCSVFLIVSLICFFNRLQAVVASSEIQKQKQCLWEDWAALTLSCYLICPWEDFDGAPTGVVINYQDFLDQKYCKVCFVNYLLLIFFIKCFMRLTLRQYSCTAVHLLYIWM